VSDFAWDSHGTASAVAEGSPYGIASRKLTMWLFIISDAVTFGALLFGYGYLASCEQRLARTLQI